MTDTDRIAQIKARVTDYLSAGGLFNPELAKHDNVRNLIHDLLAELEASRKQITGIDDAARGASVYGTGVRLNGKHVNCIVTDEIYTEEFFDSFEA
jgi:hypothetical protein